MAKFNLTTPAGYDASASGFMSEFYGQQDAQFLIDNPQARSGIKGGMALVLNDDLLAAQARKDAQALKDGRYFANGGVAKTIYIAIKEGRARNNIGKRAYAVVIGEFGFTLATQVQKDGTTILDTVGSITDSLGVGIKAGANTVSSVASGAFGFAKGVLIVAGILGVAYIVGKFKK